MMVGDVLTISRPLGSCRKLISQRDDVARGPHTVILQQFLNEVDMSEHHATTAVALHLKLIQGFTVRTSANI